MSRSVPLRRSSYIRREERIHFWCLLPCLLFVCLFSYLPLAGWVIAFTDYKPGYNLLNSNFVGTKYFTRMFANPVARMQVIQSLKNTAGMFGLGLLGGPLAMLFAIFLNEMRSSGYRRVIQTVTTLPNFISWVIMYAMVYAMFSNSGLVNTLGQRMGLIDVSINFMASDSNVWLKMWLYGTWKGLGWSAIIYLASIAGVDQELYEAAMIDGANRYQRIWHITVPFLLPTYFVLLVMSVGNFLNTGMEQYYVFQNAMNKDYIQVLDLYVYNQGIGSGSIPYATAVGMLKSLVALVLFTMANTLSKVVRGTSVF